MQRRIVRPAALALIVVLLAAGCATKPEPAAQPVQAGQPAATVPAAATAAPSAEAEKQVTWDPAVWAAFQKEVPRFVQALAKEKIEDMARENGSYYVDQALYEKAMAEYKR